MPQKFNSTYDFIVALSDFAGWYDEDYQELRISITNNKKGINVNILFGDDVLKEILEPALSNWIYSCLITDNFEYLEVVFIPNTDDSLCFHYLTYTTEIDVDEILVGNPFGLNIFKLYDNIEYEI